MGVYACPCNQVIWGTMIFQNSRALKGSAWCLTHSNYSKNKTVLMIEEQRSSKHILHSCTLSPFMHHLNSQMLIKIWEPMYILCTSKKLWYSIISLILFHDEWNKMEIKNKYIEILLNYKVPYKVGLSWTLSLLLENTLYNCFRNKMIPFHETLGRAANERFHSEGDLALWSRLEQSASSSPASWMHPETSGKEA